MGEDERINKFPLDFIKVRSESGSEDTHYSLLYEGVPNEFRRLAQETLQETDESRRSGLMKLKAFAKEEKLPCTDNDLLLVLRACKYNQKKSEIKLKKFVLLWKKFKTMVAKMDEKQINRVMDDRVIGLLPYRDKHGRVIIYSRPNINLDRYDTDQADIVVFAVIFYAISTFPLTSLTGFSYIGECKCDNLYNFYPIFNQFRKSYISLGLDAPLRIGRVDIVNENTLVRLFANMIRPILPVKISKRLFFNGKGYENLQKFYPPDTLFEDFGGNLGPINDKFYRERLLNYLRELKAESQRTLQLDSQET